MALDNQFQELIREVALMADLPTIEESPIEELRASYRERYLARGPEYEEVESIADIVIPVDDVSVSARLYSPATSENNSQALIIYFHGGGYVLGDIASYDNQSRVMANRTGASVLFVDYRLAPENKFPAAVEDAIGVVQWAFDNSPEFGWSPGRITTVGDSAGGALAVIATIAARAKSRYVASQILIYPAFDWESMIDEEAGFARYPSLVEFGEGHFLDRAYLKWFAAQYFSTREDMSHPNAGNIPDEDLVGLPPTLIVTAGCDPLRDSVVHFCGRLVRAGVELTYRNYSGMLHNFMGYASIVERAGDAFEEVCELSRRLINN